MSRLLEEMGELYARTEAGAERKLSAVEVLLRPHFQAIERELSRAFEESEGKGNLFREEAEALRGAADRAEVRHKEERAAWEAGIKCFHWNAGESPFPNELRQCKTVFLRLVLQHLSVPHELLAQIRNEFSKGTRLVLIEEDLGTTFLYPPCRGYGKLGSRGLAPRLLSWK